LPGVALSDLVSFFGIVHFIFPKGVVIPPKAYSPRPHNALYFFPRDPEYVTYPGETEKTKRPPVYIMGQHTLLTQRYVAGPEFLAIIVHFQPGALYRLTGIPSYELTDTCIDAEAVFSKEVRLVNEQLNNADSYREMIAIVESYLVKLVSQAKKDAQGIDTAAKILLQDTEHISMDWLAKETCLCAKQFERKFRERMGVNASLLARIARFDKAFKMKNAHVEKDWLSVAVLCGYYDYQHLVRDYKAFTGHTPTSFFHLDEQGPDRMLGFYEYE
jgi:AraC-like DNA-binding protein